MGTIRLVAGATLAVALVAIGTAHAGFENAGTTAAGFLSLGSGARTLSMGGATLGLGDDVGASAWNPAALGWLTEPEAALSHAGLANHGLQEWGAMGGRIGLSQTRWGVGGLYQGDGNIPGRDATGAPTGSFSVSSVALGATMAQQIGKWVTVGLGAKGVREKLATVSGSGFTFDGGLMLRAGMIGLGLAAQNLGGQLSYGPAKYRFPRNYGAGVAWTHRAIGLRVVIDANFPSAYYPEIRTGVEWNYKELLALRGGYRKELRSDADPLSGPTFGLGVGHVGMWIDYGYLLTSTGEGQHRVGLRLNLRRLGPSDEPPEQGPGSKRLGAAEVPGPAEPPSRKP